MIPLHKNKAALLAAPLLFLGLLSHSLLARQLIEPQKPLELTDRIRYGSEVVLNQRAAWFLDDQNRMHSLALTAGRELLYRTVDTAAQGKPAPGEVQPLPVPSGWDVKSTAAIGMTESGPAFLAEVKEEGSYRPFMLHIVGGNPQWTRMEWTTPWPHDSAVAYYGGSYFCVHVGHEEDAYRLYLTMVTDGRMNSPVLLAEADQIGLPAVSVDAPGNIHITWKELRGALGLQKYQQVAAGSSQPVYVAPLSLGNAAFFFGGNDGQRRYYEDISPRLVPRPGGGAFVTWTYSYCVPQLNTYYSIANLAAIPAEGHRTEVWQFKGKNSFSIAGDVALNKNGLPTVIWEDYSARTCRLWWSEYDALQEAFTEARPFTRFYGNHRFPTISYSQSGDLVAVWKELASEEDIIWFRNSHLTRNSKWYDHWSLWYAREGPGTFIRETFFLLLYSLISALTVLVRNTPVIVLFLVCLYTLERTNILTKINFFFFMAVSVALLGFLKIQVPELYASATPEKGLIFLSVLLSTAVALFASHKHWEGAGEELTYLKYIVLWVYCDSFFTALAIAPAMFTP